VTNLTHEWSQAVFDIGVGYGENVDRIMGILMELPAELRKDPKFTRLILDEPQMLGVDLFSESGIVIKFTIKTRAAGQWAVKRELLRRIKNRFDELGIRIPVPYRMILQEEKIDRNKGQEG
jgi:small-conductance mechanosensitive channel